MSYFTPYLPPRPVMTPPMLPFQPAAPLQVQPQQGYASNPMSRMPSSSSAININIIEPKNFAGGGFDTGMITNNGQVVAGGQQAPGFGVPGVAGNNPQEVLINAYNAAQQAIANYLNMGRAIQQQASMQHMPPMMGPNPFMGPPPFPPGPPMGPPGMMPPPGMPPMGPPMGPPPFGPPGPPPFGPPPPGMMPPPFPPQGPPMGPPPFGPPMGPPPFGPPMGPPPGMMGPPMGPPPFGPPGPPMGPPPFGPPMGPPPGMMGPPMGPPPFGPPMGPPPFGPPMGPPPFGPPMGPPMGPPRSFNPGSTTMGPSVEPTNLTGPSANSPLNAPSLSPAPSFGISELNQMVLAPGNVQDKLKAIQELAFRDDVDSTTFGILGQQLGSRVRGSDEMTLKSDVDSKVAAALALGVMNRRLLGNQETANLPGIKEVEAILGNRKANPRVQMAALQYLQLLDRPANTDSKVQALAKRAARYASDPAVATKAQQILNGQRLEMPALT